MEFCIVLNGSVCLIFLYVTRAYIFWNYFCASSPMKPHFLEVFKHVILITGPRIMRIYVFSCFTHSAIFSCLLKITIVVLYCCSAMPFTICCCLKKCFSLVMYMYFLVIISFILSFAFLILHSYCFYIHPMCLFLENPVSPWKHFECNSRTSRLLRVARLPVRLRVEAGVSGNEPLFIVF
jgi:hypothetical protein